MSPNEAMKEVKKRRINFKDYDFDLDSLKGIKKFLKNSYGFSDRQIRWTIELYLNDLEETRLSSDFSNMFSSPDYGNGQGFIKMEETRCLMTTLCAHDCIKIWFDKNCRILLKGVLGKLGLKNEQKNYVLYDICGFSSQQFGDEGEVADITTSLPLWLPVVQNVVDSWHEGIEEEYEKIVPKYKQEVQSYLQNYLNESQLDSLVSAFELKDSK